jgi:hypothetical protein
VPLVLADYINFMKQVTPETTQEYMTQLKRFNMGAPGESDCPVFDGMYEYFAVSKNSKLCVAPVVAVLTQPAVQCCLGQAGPLQANLDYGSWLDCCMLGLAFYGGTRRVSSHVRPLICC